MTTTDTKPVELDRNELEDLGLDVPRDFVEAWRIDDDTINVLVYDSDGCSVLDAPNEDHSGGDVWEWIGFDNGQERDEWRLENSVCSICQTPIVWDYDREAWYHEKGPKPCAEVKPGLAPTDILIERYEHSMVRYAPIGESSMVDRQWDVAFGVAVIRFTKPDDIGPADDPDKLLNAARGICEEYTSWCNGDCYGIVQFERVKPTVPVPFLTSDDFEYEWRETDASCWGFLGSTYASQAAQEGDF